MTVEAYWKIESVLHRTAGASIIASAENSPDHAMTFGISKLTARGRAFLEAAKEGSRFKATLELIDPLMPSKGEQP